MNKTSSGFLGALLGAVLAVVSLPGLPQSSCSPASPVNTNCPQGDLDLFTTNQSAAASTKPNILFVFDNSANWSNAKQKFTDGKGNSIIQAQGEVQAIQNALNALGAGAANLNVGIMEYQTVKGGSDNGGYIRFAVKTMNSTNLASLDTILSFIYNNGEYGKPAEEQSQSVPYGDLMYDAYNYFKGGTPTASSAHVASIVSPATGQVLADSDGYVTNYTQFRAPTGGTCGHNYIIFIANPASSGPTADNALTSAQSTLLGGSTPAQPNVALFTNGNVYSNLGYSSACYTQTAAGASSCSTSEPTGGYSSQCSAFDSCACDSTIGNGTTGLPACASGTQRYSVIGTNSSTSTSNSPTTTNTTPGADTGTPLGCLGDSSTSTNSATPPGPVISTTSGADTGVNQCTNDTAGTPVNSPTTNTPTNGADTGTQTACANDTATGSNSANPPGPTISTAPNTDTGVLIASCTKTVPSSSQTCPSQSAVTTGTNPTTTTTTSWSNCTYGATASCSGGKTTYDVFGTKTVNQYTTTYTYTPAPPAFSCPPTVGPTTVAGPAANQTTTTTTSWSSCTASGPTTAGCGTNQHKFEIFGNKNVASYTTTTPYTAAPPAATCPTTTTVTTGTNPTTTTQTSWSGCTVSSSSNATCGTNQHDFETFGTKTINQYTTTTTYTPNKPPTTTCPATQTVTSPGPAGNQTTTTTTSWANCSASAGASCGTNKHSYELIGDKTVSSYVTTTTTSSPTTTTLGNTFNCYSSQGSCSTSDYSAQASNYNGGLACGSPTTATGVCPNGGIRYQVQGVNPGSAPTGTVGAPDYKTPQYANLWAQYMRQNNIATTYTIDVYNAQASYKASELYASMANLGGGKYYAAQNQAAIETALGNILNEIQSVNSNFSSVALPISSTNRAQNLNQVYIGMFRPAGDATPRWYGNLKRYKVIRSANGALDLGDAAGNGAVNSQSGFLADCATSFWTSDSGTYWQGVIGDKPSPKRLASCSNITSSPWSDSPDGPFVEKGGSGEVVRLGNGGSASSVNRTMYTRSGASLATFNAANTGLDPSLVDFSFGKDLKDENGDNSTTDPRSSIQGDVIHSRPLPINYGTASATPVVIYYGSNDGTYRAVDAASGKELWSFIAPEFNAKLGRLMSNSPEVLLFGSTTTATPTPAPKDYFFDGSTGVYQANSNGGNTWIYPTMRRGGRMVYGIDVTTPATPKLLWKAGCPNLTDDSGCTVDSNSVSMKDIGQTWSLPSIAQIKGYTVSSATAPVIVMGGGYDGCLDANSATPNCTGAKGQAVYVLDAADGHVIKKFATDGGSVAADISLVDTSGDGLIDYAYAADTSGNIWRVSFVDSTGNALAPASWTMSKVAYTTGYGRRFLFGPAVVPLGGAVYLALGSGDREHPLISEYPYPSAATGSGVANRFYVYLDKLNSNTPVNLDDSTVVSDATGATCTNPPQLLLTGSTRGWFLPLGAGEQTVTSAVIAGGQVAFSTNTPTSPLDGACSTLGDAEGYLVNLFNGSGAIGVTGACGGSTHSNFPGGGLPPSPVIATIKLDDGSVETVVFGSAPKNALCGAPPLSPCPVTPAINPIRKGVYWKRSGDN